MTIGPLDRPLDHRADHWTIGPLDRPLDHLTIGPTIFACASRRNNDSAYKYVFTFAAISDMPVLTILCCNQALCCLDMFGSISVYGRSNVVVSQYVDCVKAGRAFEHKLVQLEIVKCPLIRYQGLFGTAHRYSLMLSEVRNHLPVLLPYLLLMTGRMCWITYHDYSCGES